MKLIRSMGFTRIDLLTLIAIIVILAALAAATLPRVLLKARIADVGSDFSAIMTALATYYSKHPPVKGYTMRTPNNDTDTSRIEQLKADVSHLATRSGRQVGTKGHAAARAYLIRRMTELGLQGYAGNSFELPYEAKGQRFTNLIGRLPGGDPALPPVLLGAHYDTCGPLPGADDNAAAIAMLLSLVEHLRGQRLERGILFAFFDAEEPPHFLSPEMGSIFFYHRQRAEPIHCAVVLDLVGHDVPVPGLEDLVFITGMESDPQLPEILQAGGSAAPLAQPARMPALPVRVIAVLNRYIGDLSDYHVFRLARRPYLFLSCGRWEHYHQRSDTPEKLNYEKMAALADLLAVLTPRLCQATLQGPFEGYDSTEAELYFLRKVFGPLVDTMGLPLNSRRDIDALVTLMLTQFGL